MAQLLAVWCAVLSLVLVESLHASERPKVTLTLKNGDRLTGELLSEDAQRLVITTPWNAAIFVPKSAIASREDLPLPTPAPEAPAPTVAAKPATPAPKPEAKPSTPAKRPSPVKLNVRIGSSFISGARDQEIYTGQATLTYTRSYKESPKQFFRNVLEYRVDYGKTDGRVTANRMSLTDRMDADLKNGFFGTLWALGGYDEVRRIDSQFEVGPGLGYRVLTSKPLVVTVESGYNWQLRNINDGTQRELHQVRLRQDLTWQVASKVTFTERFEFLPFIEDFGEYQVRAEATLAFGLVRSVSLNLSFLNLYDTQPAPSVPNNELQFRTTLGLNF